MAMALAVAPTISMFGPQLELRSGYPVLARNRFSFKAGFMFQLKPVSSCLNET